MNIITQLNWRYATKVLDSSKKISKDNLETILEAIRLTPSSFGLQPWKFLIIENPEIREKLKPNSWNQSQITDASHLLVFCNIKKIDKQYILDYIDFTSKTRSIPKENLDGYKDMMINYIVGLSEEKFDTWAKNQVYIALGNAITGCAILGIDSCPIEGFDKVKYDEILDLDKKGLKSAVVLPIGYRSENDKYSGLEKIRFSKEKMFEII